MAVYFRPDTLEEAIKLKAASDMTVLAGGTDIFPARINREAWSHRNDPDILDITKLDELRGISTADGNWRIGALTTWTAIIDHDLPPLFDGLKLAAIEVGGRQIQNAGTLAGNICNASPAADGIPCLAAMDANVETSGKDGKRTIPILEFVDGYRHTVLKPDELVTAIIIPERSDNTRSHFLKLGARRYLVISIAMVACVIEADDAGAITHAAISVGACSEKAVRLDKLEAALTSQKMHVGLGNVVSDSHLEELKPIDDVRASGEYRLSSAKALVRELLNQIATGQLERVA